MAEIDRVVEEIVEDEARKTIGDEILSVHAVSDVGCYGDEIFRVKVVFEPKTKEGLLDTNKTWRLFRGVLKKLSERGAAGLPVISYISASEYKNSKAYRQRKANPEFA